MYCDSCGADLPEDARFCARCGARVALGSLLGVGTDLPPVVSTRPHTPAVGPASGQAQGSAPAARDRGEPADPVDGNRSGRGGDFTAGRIAALAATFVVLTVLGTLALSQLFGSDSTEPPAASSTSAAQGSESPSAGASPDTSPETSPESSPEPSPTQPSTAAPTPEETLPAGARKCSTSGDDAVATAYSGNRDTSCAFTNAVRKAYREAGAPVDPTSFRAYSTVTKKWYDVTCGEGTIVRCASSNQAAVVFLGP